MLKENSKGLLIVVFGPSGAGKGTICNELIKEMDNTKLSISMTSREPRGKEINGIDYYFVTKEDFEKKINNDEFLEYAVVHHNNYYGTPKATIEEDLKNGKNVILEIDIQGALQVKEKVKEAIFIFIMPPSMEILKERLIKRNTETNDKVLERFKTAYKEINEYKKYNYIVINDEIETSVNKVKSIILAEKCRVDRIEDIYLNTEEEFIHEGLIDKKFDNHDLEI